MEFLAFHGCYAEEKRAGNRFLVSLHMETDASAVTVTDSVSDTVNYLSVYELVSAQMKITCNTLEFVASMILEALFERFPAVGQAGIKVSKMYPPLGGKIEKVSVSMSKKR